MGYEVISSGDETLIRNAELQVNVRIGSGNPGSAFALGWLYRMKGGFIPAKTYMFEVLDDPEISLEALKKVMDFFFSDLLDTEWFVKEVPPDSSLFTQQAERRYGKEAMEEHDGAIGVIRAGRSE